MDCAETCVASVTYFWTLAPSAGLNMSDRQKDGREESEETTICETGPGLHRPSAHRRNHLPRDL